MKGEGTGFRDEHGGEIRLGDTVEVDELGKIEIMARNNTETADFLPGDKVVCVDTNWEYPPWASHLDPYLGQVCCVKSVFQFVGRTAFKLTGAFYCGGYFSYHFRRVHR